MNSPPQCAIIAGPTAVGKSRVALALAERLGAAEIVNVDAYQVYRGLAVLTDAPAAAARARVPHHLVECVDPGVAMDAAAYAALARRALDDIRGRGRRALLVGGSGMYLSAIFGLLGGMPPSDPTLRADLDAKPNAELLALLDARDPLAGRRIDRHNRRRVLRALEVCLLTGQPYSSLRADWSGGRTAGGGAQFPPGVLLLRPRGELAARIARRSGWMLDNGAIEEVRALAPQPAPTAAKALGFAEIREHIAGRCSRNECRARIEAGTRQYAKRQLTWFRNRAAFPALDISGLSDDEAAAQAAARLDAAAAAAAD